jgi:hypothetical protein
MVRRTNVSNELGERNNFEANPATVPLSIPDNVPMHASYFISSNRTNASPTFPLFSVSRSATSNASNDSISNFFFPAKIQAYMG